MKTTLVGAMLLVAANAAAQTPDDTLPTPTDPDPTDPTTEAPPPPPQPVPTVDPTMQPVQPAQPVQQQPVTNVNVNVEAAEEEDIWSMDRLGLSITLGGGVQGFTGDTMRNTTNDGGNWDVRLGIGTRLPVSLEASYIGSAQEIDALGLDTDAILVGNGLQGNLRINGTMGEIPVQPFLFGGVAWRRYQLQNTDFNTSDVLGEDDVFEIPMGVGMAFKASSFAIDLRGEYRHAFSEDLFPAEGRDIDDIGDPASLHRWGVNANIGVEF
jgi:hypothetical protein